MPNWFDQTLRVFLPGALVVFAILALAEYATQNGLINRALFPPPSLSGETFVALILSGEFIGPLGETLWRLAAGFAIGVIGGAALGLAMGYWTAAYNFFEPFVELLRPIPKAALVPAMVLFLGIGDSMKITSIALAVFFPVLVNAIQGTRGVDPVLIDTGRTFGYGSTQILYKIILPSAMPFIFAAMRIGLGIGLVLAVLSEMLAGTGGIGFLIIDLQRSFRIRDMYAWIAILALTGLALNMLMTLTERLLLQWQTTGASADPARR